MSRRGIVKVALRDDRDLKPLGQILESQTISIDTPTKRMSGAEEAEYLKSSPALSRTEYNGMLAYLHQLGNNYHSVYDQTAINLNTRFFLPYMRRHTEVNIGDRTYSTQRSHDGNSAIQFVYPLTERKDTGFIEAIWSAPLQSKIQTFFVVRPHNCLSPTEERRAPFAGFNEMYGVRIVDNQNSSQLFIIEQQHIITHLSTIRRPAGTYGIPRETLVVCWSLNRGRR